MSLSLRFTARSLLGDMATSRIVYICGRNSRSETCNCVGHSFTTPPTHVRCECGSLVAYIHNRDVGYSFWVDLENCLYSACRANKYGSPAWLKPRGAQLLKPSGKIVHILADTIDTGDRKTLFGYTARRVISKTRHMRDLQLVSESECDGWYIDPPPAWVGLHPPNKTFHVLSSTSDGTRNDFKFTATGARESGFLTQATWASRFFSRDDTGKLRTHETIAREEVTDLSESPLPAELFVPPRYFRRVLQLPHKVDDARPLPLRFRWEMLKDSFGLARKIKAFSASP